MSDDKNRMKPSDRKHVEEMLLAEVRKFIDEVERASPSWDDGEEHSIQIRGARAGYTDDDHPLFSFGVKRTTEEML
jgi:hypothetical protein